jgi:hypothetical protein
MANDIIIWKYIWNDLLSDIEFRNYLVNQGDYRLYQNGKIDDNTSSESKNKNRGTFYLKFGKLGHFVAYKIDNKKIKIFDPSYDPNRVKGLYSGCFPPFIDTVRKHFGDIEYITDFGTVQTHRDDSFCQTWSLTYLLGIQDNTFKKLLKDAGSASTENDIIPILFEICKRIIDSRKFEEYCAINKDLLGKWGSAVSNKTAKWKNGDQFIEFSEKLTLAEFRKLFR